MTPTPNDGASIRNIAESGASGGSTISFRSHRRTPPAVHDRRCRRSDHVADARRPVSGAADRHRLDRHPRRLVRSTSCPPPSRTSRFRSTPVMAARRARIRSRSSSTTTGRPALRPQHLPRHDLVPPGRKRHRRRAPPIRGHAAPLPTAFPRAGVQPVPVEQPHARRPAEPPFLRSSHARVRRTSAPARRTRTAPAANMTGSLSLTACESPRCASSDVLIRSSVTDVRCLPGQARVWRLEHGCRQGLHRRASGSRETSDH